MTNAHPQTNGTLHAVASATSPAPVRAAAILLELDELIAMLDSAIAEAGAARITIADAETEMALIEASLLLETTESNAERRKAALTLVLRDHAGYQTHAQAARAARAALFSAERRVTVAKTRIGVLRAVLALYAKDAGAAEL